ncbi:MAG: MOSC domain-containing protein [Microcoleus vaginatus WJT46-NPBG5]|jgi:uncharacterized protein YcbX|nr:MOSC domain-containing protein [Microcoleus vaginatus WJT46-NPBG5]
MTPAAIKQLFTYPIKGLTPHECDRVTLEAGHGIPGDRAFALMYVEAGKISDPQESVPWLPKGNFAMQNDWPGLAGLQCHYDPQTGNLSVHRQEVPLFVANTGTPAGRDLIGAFFTGYLASLHPTATARHPEKAPLRLVGNGTGTTRYPDRQPVHISLVSQATLDAITTEARQPVDARRFRPNIVIDGVPAWEEFNWIGKELQIGETRIAISARIGRCANIDVNPETGERDIPLFSLLPQKFGHAQTGVLATVIAGGPIAVGDYLNQP